MAVKIRIVANTRQELTQAIGLLVKVLGTERLNSFSLPDRPGRKGDWLTYFTLDIESDNPEQKD